MANKATKGRKERQSSAPIHFEGQTERAYDKSRYQIAYRGNRLRVCCDRNFDSTTSAESDITDGCSINHLGNSSNRS